MKSGAASTNAGHLAERHGNNIRADRRRADHRCADHEKEQTSRKMTAWRAEVRSEQEVKQDEHSAGALMWYDALME